MSETNSYQEILDAYLSLQNSSSQLFEEPLEEPIMIESCIVGEPPHEVTSISDLWLVPYGSVLCTRNDEYVRVSTIPGWVRWDGVSVTHSEVYREILSAAANSAFLAWMRPSSLSSRHTVR